MTKKYKRMQGERTTNGITLIALVVTIVVLLILAGVTINAILGDDGIIAQAKKASDAAKQGATNDEENLKDMSDQLNNMINGGETDVELMTLEEAKKKGTPFEKTTEITDGEDTMWVPEKFTVIEGDKIDDGVVVQDPQRNEFVWAPIKTIGDMVYCYDHPNSIVSYNEAEDKLECEQCKTGNKGTNFAGKLYASSTKYGNNFNEKTVQTDYNVNNSSYTGIREPDVVIGNGGEYDAVADNLKIVLENYKENDTADTFKMQLQAEFNEMAKSVAKYKGFYIGRYETSGVSNNGTTYEEISQGTVLKNQTNINIANWYRQYVSNKKIGSNYKDVATTSMIWGCQWDQVMLWMKNADNTKDTSKKYIKDSTGMGNYKGTQGEGDKIIPTGSNDDYVMKNIYDMAGNLDDWTMEAYDIKGRETRGGSFYVDGLSCPASLRYSHDSHEYMDHEGSRSIIYIK